MHRDSTKNGKRDRMRHLITVKIQQCLIDALKETRSAMNKRLANVEAPEQFSQENYDILAESVEAEFMSLEGRTRRLEVLLHRENVKLDHAKYHRNESEFRMKKCEEILYDVKYAVACALKV